jgi:MFS family permease
MEVMILGWYVLVESESVLLLVIFGALQYAGSLISPFFGVAGDRIGYRRLFVMTRLLYALMSILLALLAACGLLTPLLVLILAGICGMIKPSDIMMRFALIGQTLPGNQVIGALGLSRVTTDSARIAGALAGVGVFTLFGLVPAYIFVSVLYLLSCSLALGVATDPRSNALPLSKQLPAQGTPKGPSLYQDLRQVFAYVWRKPELLGAFSLAFLVNIFAYPLFLGLLPYVANNIYNIGQAGLGLLVVSYASGSLLGSLVVSSNRFSVGPARLMLIFSVVWFGVDLAFSWTTYLPLGMFLLACAGFAQNICLVPLAGVMLKASEPAYRGRVMGMRMLAIVGLPAGLMLSGPLINQIGFTMTASIYSVIGLLLTGAIALRWRQQLWSKRASINTNQELDP